MAPQHVVGKGCGITRMLDYSMHGRVKKARLLFRHFSNQDNKMDYHQYVDFY